MGVCYELLCHDCKKMVDLDKNRSFPPLWHGHESDDERTKSFYDLVVPTLFMRRHWGHNVDLISDCSDNYGALWSKYEHEDVRRPKAQT